MPTPTFLPASEPSIQQPAPPVRADQPTSPGLDDGTLRVRGLARGITVNRKVYAPLGIYVPNGFSQDPSFTVSAFTQWVNRTRVCDVGDGNSSYDCVDAQAYFSLTPLKGEYASLGLLYTIQSLSGRNNGTEVFEGQSLGFRADFALTPTTGFAVGGEHIIQFDDTTDLGRNFYFVLSHAIPLNQAEQPILLVATAGIGSDFFGYGGNAMFSTDCLGTKNLTSRDYPSGRDCSWGPIGSLSLSWGPQIGIGLEWFGFGFGAGINVLPIRSLPLTLSFYATDFLGNFPDYIQNSCTDNPCRARFYGQATFSF
jgi:hypothetical protein